MSRCEGKGCQDVTNALGDSLKTNLSVSDKSDRDRKDNLRLQEADKTKNSFSSTANQFSKGVDDPEKPLTRAKLVRNKGNKEVLARNDEVTLNKRLKMKISENAKQIVTFKAKSVKDANADVLNIRPMCFGPPRKQRQTKSRPNEQQVEKMEEKSSNLAAVGKKSQIKRIECYNRKNQKATQ